MPWHDPSPHGELEGMGNSGKEATEYFSFTKKKPLFIEKQPYGAASQATRAHELYLQHPGGMKPAIP